MRRAARRAGSGSSWGREKSEPAVERRQDGVLVLLHRGGIGGAPAERRDAGRHHQRVRGADRGAQVVDVGQHVRRQRHRARPQAVDARDVALEGQRHELGVLGIAGDVEGQLPAEVPRAHAARAGHLDERAHQGGDQQPGALADGVGIGAQRGRGGRHRAQRPVGAAHGDEDGLLVARALAGQLERSAVQLGVEQGPQPRDARPLGDRRREIVHDRLNATRASTSVRSHP